ncbi:MAG TPA: NAD(P)/FAD-dependent oxidoreductase [Usitatibacter sp.]|nr:NAD(P)/FAD-dependent oxidoreductase [Usitatibacter sp.]
MKLHDALVIGGGPAGATLATRLALQGQDVALVEKATYPRRKVCGEFVSAATWPLLGALGVATKLERKAGPAVTRVGLFAGEGVAEAPMPAPRAGARWGRAIGRHVLDEALLERARRAGVAVRQPGSVTHAVREPQAWRIRIDSRSGVEELQGRLLVDAHGSWERSPLDVGRTRPGERDLLAFKARFLGASLSPGLMPLVLFPGGYGGLVQSDSGTVSLSCCIRRGALRAARASHRGAGDALLAHITRHCRGVREALDGARLEAPWLAAGPIRPGIRLLHEGDLEASVFRIGNAAGEAHPLIAEGVSMAVQSAWLLAEALGSERDTLAAARRYQSEWRAHLAFRVRASSAFAGLTTFPATAAASVALLRVVPALLTLGALWSGKAHLICPEAS